MQDSKDDLDLAIITVTAGVNNSMYLAERNYVVRSEGKFRGSLLVDFAYLISKFGLLFQTAISRYFQMKLNQGEIPEYTSNWRTIFMLWGLGERISNRL